GAFESADHFWKQTADRHEQLRHDIERPILPPDELWLSPDALRERLNRGDRVEVCGATHPRHAQAQPLGDQPAPALPLAARDAGAGAALKSFLANYPGRVLVAADSAGRREALLEVLEAAELRPEVLPDFASFLIKPPLPLAGEGRGEGLRGAGPSSGPSGHLLPQAGEGNTGSRFAIAVAPLDDGF